MSVLQLVGIHIKKGYVKRITNANIKLRSTSRILVTRVTAFDYCSQLLRSYCCFATACLGVECMKSYQPTQTRNM